MIDSSDIQSRARHPALLNNSLPHPFNLFLLKGHKSLLDGSFREGGKWTIKGAKTLHLLTQLLDLFLFFWYLETNGTSCGIHSVVLQRRKHNQHREREGVGGEGIFS